MKRYFILLACGLLPLWQGPVQAQGYSAEQLQSLIAPIALYPDTLVFEVLRAVLHPDDVIAAGNSAGIDNPAWDADVRALVGFPELLERMAENPLWMRELGYAGQRQQMELVQALAAMRSRAYATGTVGGAPLQELVYYDPLVVYGTWQPSYPLPRWRQWQTRRGFTGGRQRPEVLKNGPPSKAAEMQANQPQVGTTRGNGAPSKAVEMQANQPQVGITRGNGGPSPARLLEQKRP